MDSIRFICTLGFEAIMPTIIHDNILNYCHISRQKEIGGILIGKYSPDNQMATITFASGPPPDSKFGFFSFKRGTHGLMQLLDDRWEFGEYYIGDWHYHPRSASQPSRQDISQMRCLAVHQGLKCPEPLLLIVGGSSSDWNYSMNIITSKGIFPMQAHFDETR